MYETPELRLIGCALCGRLGGQKLLTAKIAKDAKNNLGKFPMTAARHYTGRPSNCSRNSASYFCFLCVLCDLCG
jgi:hypothetical protein